MADERMALIELVENSADTDSVREMLSFVAERLMEAEVEGAVGEAKGAARHFRGRSATPTANRGGTRALAGSLDRGTHLRLARPMLQTGEGLEEIHRFCRGLDQRRSHTSTRYASQDIAIPDRFSSRALSGARRSEWTDTGCPR